MFLQQHSFGLVKYSCTQTTAKVCNDLLEKLAVNRCATFVGGRLLNFQGMMREEWAIPVGTEFYLFRIRITIYPSRSCMIFSFSYIIQYAIFFSLTGSLDHVFTHNYLTPLPLNRTFCTAIQPPASVQPA